MDQKISINAAALLDVFDNEPNEVLGEFMRQVETFNISPIEKEIMTVWINGYYTGKNYGKD